MKVSAGETTYVVGKAPCSGVGLKWLEEELNDALEHRVAEVLFDDEGAVIIEEILADVTATDFAQDALRRVLAKPSSVEDWRVGEAIAEAYLTDNRSCDFPWTVSRDEKKRESSLAGADLVGFSLDDEGDCFAFGEVKTSSDSRYPPGTMYGRTGLKQQLEDLRDRESLRDGLMKYLGHRARSADWRGRYERASRRYLQNSSDVQLYGFLVRDVKPHQNDLARRVHDLASESPEGTRIELIALYLPRGRLDGIGDALTARRSGVAR